MTESSSHPSDAADVPRPSFWRDRSSGSVSPDVLPARADAVVIGAGITGLSIAAELATRDVTVAVLEARRLAGGTTGASTAKVTALHGAGLGELRRRRGDEVAGAHIAANLAGLAQIRSLADAAGAASELHDGVAVTYSAERARDNDIHGALAAGAALGLPAREIGSAERDELPFEVSSGMALDGQAMVDPVALCASLAGLVRRSGGVVVEQCRVRSLDDTTVRTARGSIGANAVVLATLMPVIDPTFVFARVEPMVSYTLAAELSGPAPAGMYLGVGEPTRSIRPEAPGSSVAIIGGGGHRVGAGGDTREHSDELERWARWTFDVREVRSRWHAHDLQSVDLVPHIGPVGRRGAASRTFVASGFGKWGLTNAGAASLIIAGAIDGEVPEWAEPFDPRRLVHDARSLADLVSTNVSVGRHFIGDRVRSLPRSAEQLDRGEAAVVRVGGRKVAARRTEDGTLVTRSAVCPHLGCEVVWNPVAASWDCPCHGSRFDARGDVLDGPARGGLSER